MRSVLRASFSARSGDFPFNLVVNTGEQFADRLLEHRFTGERGAESQAGGKPLIPADLGTASPLPTGIMRLHLGKGRGACDAFASNWGDRGDECVWF